MLGNNNSGDVEHRPRGSWEERDIGKKDLSPYTPRWVGSGTAGVHFFSRHQHIIIASKRMIWGGNYHNVFIFPPTFSSMIPFPLAQVQWWPTGGFYWWVKGSPDNKPKSGVKREAVKKRKFGTIDLNWVGSGGSKLLWHIWPLFVENFRQIHEKYPKSMKLRGWVGGFQKFGSIGPNFPIFFTASLTRFTDVHCFRCWVIIFIFTK